MIIEINKSLTIIIIKVMIVKNKFWKNLLIFIYL